MKLSLSAVLLFASAPITLADVYLHNPRGSNNRNCGQNQNRNNGNRLFDSENNAKGGYACPRAFPFDCYKYEAGDEKDACNARNTEDASAEMIDRATGELVHPEAIATSRMYYHSGSVIPIEWTNQHGGGSNGKVHSEIILQVACEDTLTDDCGDDDPTTTCGPRDGTPVNNQDSATTTIGVDSEDQLDYRRGRHETLEYYKKCMNRERNKGLFRADQNLNGNYAMITRQNPNNNRQGLECKEEAHYWPYWHDSPWIDIAVITSDMGRCEMYRAESQNVKAKHECVCEEGACNGNGALPNNENACIEKQGNWVAVPAHNTRYPGLGAPECVAGEFSRDNHLGNVQSNGYPYSYNWTVPTFLENRDSCILRIRYNVSTGDANDVSVSGDFKLNGAASPIYDRNNREDDSYTLMQDLGLMSNGGLGMAVQTNQYGRTFQDRTYTFSVKPRPEEISCTKIHNLNVRGKRGNIVQAYPSVEYDFVPNTLVVDETDCVHVQWTGSDYNPNRNPNNGEGGPPHPINNNQGRTDRSNIVQMSNFRENQPVSSGNQFNMFTHPTMPQADLVKKLMFIDQPIMDPNQCKNVTEMREIESNQDARERHHLNCGKLSGAKTPYFNAGLLKPGQTGTHHYMSSRNNNFTNRTHKAVMIVKSVTLSGAAAAGVAVGAVVGVGLAAAGLIAVHKKRKAKQSTVRQPPITAVSGKGGLAKAASPMATPVPMAKETVVAAYDHETTEDGELAFRMGDRIEVLEKDASGWWTGRGPSGATGLFPSNYVNTSTRV